jgi:YHS domain-containing protein
MLVSAFETGCDRMSEQGILRRSLLAAAVSAATFTQPGSAEAQTGNQPAPANNPMVVSELNKIFTQNGQEMPSMRPSDLPNANVHRFKQPAAQQKIAQSQPPLKTPAAAAQRPKKNAFQKMLGRIRGGSSTNSGESGQPSSEQSGLSSYSGAPPNSAATMNKNPATGRPAANGNVMVPPMPGIAGDPTRQSTAQVPSGNRPPRQMQPQGNSPSFLSTSRPAPNAAQVPQVPVPANPRKPVNRLEPIQPAPVAPPADDFVDPFTEPEIAAPDKNDSLDLDSLLEVPSSASTAETEGTQDSGERPSTDNESPENESADRSSVQEPAASLPQQPSANTPEGEAAEVPESEENPADSSLDDLNTPEEIHELDTPQNPFTGVQLDVSEQEYSEEVGRAEMNVIVRDSSAAGDQPLTEQPLSQPPENQESEPEVISASPAASAETAAETVNDPVETPSSESPQSKDASAPAASPAVPTITPAAAGDTEETARTPEQLRREQQQKKLESRAGQTGFKGFCPVNLRNRRELVDANSEITAKFGLQTYSFADKDAKSAFESAPARYAPAAGGSDVVLLVNGGEEQPGSLDFCLWYHDRLYMFRSRETMAAFSREPSKYASQY